MHAKIAWVENYPMHIKNISIENNSMKCPMHVKNTVVKNCQMHAKNMLVETGPMHSEICSR